MAIYRFTVEIEDYEGITRTIEVKSTQTFEDLHYAILRAFAFDIKHPASFFYSDDLWHMEDEIAFKDAPYSVMNDAMPMNKTKICDYVDDPHQRFLYVYQSDEGWAFLLELVNIDTGAGDGNLYPRMTKGEGEAPKQYPVKNVVKSKAEDKPLLVDPLEDDLEEATDELVAFESLEATTKKGSQTEIDLDITLDEEEETTGEDDFEEDDDFEKDDDDDGGRDSKRKYDDDDDY